jgi:hypothetical protein
VELAINKQDERTLKGESHLLGCYIVVPVRTEVSRKVSLPPSRLQNLMR